jgi:hypothetical protein
MPRQEITAPFYVNVKYTTTAYPLGHRFRLYFDHVPAFNATTTVFATYTDAGHPTGWTLAQIVEEVLTRFFSQTPFGAYTITNVEMWTTNVGVNTFVGLDPDDYSGVAVGSGSGKASAYAMYVFTAGNKAQWRLTMFEVASGDPQRYAQPDPPAVDDTTLAWFVIRSAVKFVTNDNLPLVHVPSTNIGFNKALARKYGRFITP